MLYVLHDSHKTNFIHPFLYLAFAHYNMTINVNIAVFDVIKSVFNTSGIDKIKTIIIMTDITSV